jgi:hypothetical protein
MPDSTTLYTAVLQGKNNIVVYDALKGVKTYTVNLGAVDVVNGPVVTKDRMTVVVKNNQNRLECRIYTLPRGVLTRSFTL